NARAAPVPAQRPGAAHPPVPQGRGRHRRRIPVERRQAGGVTNMSTITRTLPEGFAELEPYVHDWAKPTRAERYATRLSKPFLAPPSAQFGSRATLDSPMLRIAGLPRMWGFRRTSADVSSSRPRRSGTQ